MWLVDFPSSFMVGSVSVDCQMNTCKTRTEKVGASVVFKILQLKLNCFLVFIIEQKSEDNKILFFLCGPSFHFLILKIYKFIFLYLYLFVSKV